jgi:hypothetical protein
MKISVFLLSISMTLVSCGFDEKKKEENPLDEVAGIQDVPERIYNNTELSIGRRICRNINAKTAFYNDIINTNKRLHFTGEVQNCGSTTINSLGEFTLGLEYSNQSFLYTSTRSNFFRDTITDVSGNMEDMCKSLAASDSVSNTLLDGNGTVAITFIIEGGYDQVQFVSKRAGKIVSKEAAFIYTQAPVQTSTRYLGLEKDRIRYTVCPDGKTVSVLRQTWKKESI